MNVLEVILPVLLLMAVGFVGRRLKFLTADGVDSIKNIVMKVILPVAIFNALASATFSGESLVAIGVLLAVIVVSFGVGFLLRKLVREPYGKYLPFVVSVYEGGLFGYALYVSLVGKDNLSYIAILDIAGLLFGFGVYMNVLRRVETGEKFSMRSFAATAFGTPAFVATLLGLIVGATGFYQSFVGTAAGEIYLACENLLTLPLTPLVLIVVGFNFSVRGELLAECFKTVAIRFVLQAILVVAVLTVFRRAEFAKEWQLAAIVLMSCPTSFSTQTFISDPDGAEYVATTNSLYCAVTIVVYIVLAAIL